jgi:hypothetical protein
LWQGFELCNYSRDAVDEDNPLFDRSLGNSQTLLGAIMETGN